MALVAVVREVLGTEEVRRADEALLVVVMTVMETECSSSTSVPRKY